MSQLALVAAVADNGAIGRDGDLPWHLPADLRHFKKLTVGHTLLMGRRTFESIGRPLPRRRTLVLSRGTFAAPGVETAPDVGSALAMAAGEQVFVVGGSSVYAATLPLASTLFLTRVHAEVPGDVFFPDVDWSSWQLAESERHEADPRHAFSFTFERHRRRAPNPARNP